ncbi:transmembrane protein 238-like [Poecilia reticulata]|uniref:transmembrane protein 238-like n=1 Tax=Poecilia reticulata TaxID=8081 RepID=UPI0004A4F748|nr:PREDICTED: transmembrane protein 238-like [Poecilia reticulata]
MSTSVQIAPVMEETYDGVGRCKCAFWLAVVQDVLGVLVIMVGVFSGLVIHDVFIYGGAIVIFLSLIWWIFWYSGNIDVPPEELEDDVGLMKTRDRRLSRAVRRVSNGIRNSFRKKARPVEEGPSGGPGPSDCGTDVTLSTIYGSSKGSSSKQLVRETLSI